MLVMELNNMGHFISLNLKAGFGGSNIWDNGPLVCSRSWADSFKGGGRGREGERDVAYDECTSHELWFLCRVSTPNGLFDSSGGFLFCFWFLVLEVILEGME